MADYFPNSLIMISTLHRICSHMTVCDVFFFIALIWFVFFARLRYRIEYEALSKVESEQNEFIDQFILQK